MILYGMGHFIDDYAVGPSVRNDLGLMFLVTFEGAIPTRIEAIPLALDYCYTRLAEGDEARWITDRFQRACEALGTDTVVEHGRLVIDRSAL